MKTKKQIFTPPKYIGKPRSYFEPCEPLILWSVRLYDYSVVMPELTLLIEANYFEN